MPIINKDGYTLTKEVLPQEYASTIPPLSITSDKIAEEAITTDKIHPDVYLVPQGGIIMWSGAIDAVPTGWHLCDGTNGTPDLRNKFMVGAGSTYSVGGTGGSADAIVVSHNHTATSSVSDPGHNHSITLSGTIGAGGQPAGWVNTSEGTGYTNAGGTNISVYTSVGATGSSATNANLPPYYAIAYIMKL